MLTQQLRELEKDSIIKRKIYRVVPLKVEYSLSDYGLTLSPILEAMADWGGGQIIGHNKTEKNSHKFRGTCNCFEGLGDAPSPLPANCHENLLSRYNKLFPLFRHSDF